MTRLAPMSKLLKLTPPITALVLGVVCAVLIASCGGSGGKDLIPGATASQLDEALDQIEQLADDGQCSDAASSAEQVATQLETQQSDINPELKQALVDGFQRVQVLASDPATCSSVSTQETTTEETTTEEQTTTEETTPPPETQTETQPPNTQTTPTTDTGTGGTGGNGGGPGL
jgi:hypothetical protein